jgi:hypothetical protein
MTGIIVNNELVSPHDIVCERRKRLDHPLSVSE